MRGYYFLPSCDLCNRSKLPEVDKKLPLFCSFGVRTQLRTVDCYRVFSTG